MSTEDTTKADDIIDDFNKVSALCRKHAGHIRDIRMSKNYMDEQLQRMYETRDDIRITMERLKMDPEKIRNLLDNLPKP